MNEFSHSKQDRRTSRRTPKQDEIAAGHATHGHSDPVDQPPSPSVGELRINKTPACSKVQAARLFRDAEDAISVGRLARAVLGRDIDGKIYLDPRGTFVALMPELPLLEGLECGDPVALTRLIAPLNELLQKRIEIIQGATNPALALAESDAEIGALGHRDLLPTLIDLARARERQLLIEGEDGAGGTLIIPPHPLISMPPTARLEDATDIETVTRVVDVTEVLTHAGSMFVVRSSAVDEAVRAGARARLLHPRRNSVSWRTARTLKHIVVAEGDRT